MELFLYPSYLALAKAASCGSLGNFEKALKLFQEALSIFREIGFKDKEANQLHNIELIYKAMGKSG